jgi:hypothetical protein
MPLFVMVGTDGPGGIESRARLRPAHLARLRPLADAGRIRFAGPLRDAAGSPHGSVVVFEAASLAEARELMAGDPYVTGGVFASWSVSETLQVFPEPH